MSYNFDKIIERQGTDSLKYGVLHEQYGREDLLPMWIADMDFETAPEVINALEKRARHSVFGYSFASKDYYNAIINWQQRRNAFDISQKEICFLPGVVKGIAFAVDCFTAENDEIIIQSPVYHPFKIIPTLHHRKIITNPLIFNGQQYDMNFEGLEDVCKQHNCKMLILSNPHNPSGRVWTNTELARLAEICKKYNMLVISDEIHSDLTFSPHKHTTFASVSQTAADISITMNAVSKSFNLAGLASAYAIIKNEKIREQFHRYLNNSELSDGIIFAYLALQTAYDEGEAWLEELKKYLWENILYVDDFLKKNVPDIKVVLPQASFLLWLDCRKLQMEQKDLVSLFTNNLRLALNDGTMFGIEGTGFMRMNIGYSRATIAIAMERLLTVNHHQ
jgi:cystathionine beta-lyase